VSDEPQRGTGAALQFERVEFATATATQVCAVCKTAITDSYFAVGGAVICPVCSEKLTGKNAGGAAFLRAWLWGGGVAVLGSIVWYLIAKLANMELGIVAIAVGYGVGMAVRRASRGRGGWKFQALAIFLTYASIVTSYVPFVIQGLRQAAEKNHAAEQAKSEGKTDDGASAANDSHAKPDAAKPRSKPSAGGFLLACAFILGLAFAAPFLGGASNFMGLIIIAIALYEAWKLNRRIPVTGPFRVAATPGAGPPPAAP
jgi:hypothetical protein